MILAISSCGKKDVPPISYLYALSPGLNFCIEYPIQTFNPLTVGKGTIITDVSKCPKMVIGLRSEEWPELLAWIWKKQRHKPDDKSQYLEGNHITDDFEEFFND